MTAKTVIPKEVILATNLLWGACFFTIIDFFTISKLSDIFTATLFLFGLYYWITSQIKNRKNWMRILSALTTVMGFISVLASSNLFNIFGILINGLSCVAIFLLFSKNSSKFFEGS